MRSIKFAFILFLAGFLFLISLDFSSAISSKANHSIFILCEDSQCTESGFMCNMSRLDEGYSSPLVDLSSIPNGCSLNNPSSDYVQNGGATCCPLGNTCEFDESQNAHFCVPVNAFCSYYEEDYQSDYNIVPYDAADYCNNDPLNLGTRIGNNPNELKCGDEIFSSGDEESFASGIYRISECECEWESNKCNNIYTAKCNSESCEDGNDDGSGGNLRDPKCTKHYSYTECIDNKQTYSWTASAKYSNGVPILPTTNTSSQNYRLLEELNCFPDSETRSCGEPTIELPGFSTFALIFSLTLIIFFHILRLKKEDNL